MNYHLIYHNGPRPIQIPKKANMRVLRPVAMPARESLSKMSDRVLNSTPLSRLMPGNDPLPIAIAIPDGTQPVPTKTILPIIIEQLFHTLPSINPAAVIIILASGLQEVVGLISHAVQEGEKKLLLVGCQKGFGEDIYFDNFCSFADQQAVKKALIQHN